MLKSELTGILNELFALGGNQDVLKLNEIRKRLVDFLSHTEQLLGCQDNENVIIAKDAVRLLDALSVYAETTDRNKANSHVQPFFDRLIQSDGWSQCDLQFLITSVEYIKNVEQLLELSDRAISEISKYQDNNNSAILEGYLAFNMCSRILYAKFFDDAKTDFLVQFATWALKLENLLDKNNELSQISLITQIRRAIFHRAPTEIVKLCEDLKNNYDENIHSTVEKEVRFYITSEKYINYL